MSLEFWEVVKLWQQDYSIKCRPIGKDDNVYRCPMYWEDSSKDPNIKWEIDSKKVTITREDMKKAWRNTFPYPPESAFERFCESLGL